MPLAVPKCTDQKNINRQNPNTPTLTVCLTNMKREKKGAKTVQANLKTKMQCCELIGHKP
jgi:hypothetical protein